MNHPQEHVPVARDLPFPDEVSALGERIAALRAGMDDSPQAQAVLVELGMAYEELRVAEEEVRSQEEEIRRLTESHQLMRWQHQRVMEMLPTPVVTTDRAGSIRSANAAASGLFGVPLPHLVRKPLLALIATEDRPGLRDQLQRMDADRSLRRVVTIAGRGGRSVVVEANASPESSALDVALTWVFLAATPGRRHGTEDPSLPAALVELATLPAADLEKVDVLRRAAGICQIALGDRVTLSLNLGSPAAPAALSSSSTLAQGVDGAQLALDEGPCVTAFDQRRTVVTTDMSKDERWSHFAADPRVSDAGGAIAVPMMLGDDLLGALNVYGDIGDPPDERLTETAELLAAGVGAVFHELAVREELKDTAADMERALSSRATIDQARGMIMADRGCTPEEAFEHLIELSSTRHIKLRDLARQIVEQRSAPKTLS